MAETILRLTNICLKKSLIPSLKLASIVSQTSKRNKLAQIHLLDSLSHTRYSSALNHLWKVHHLEFQKYIDFDKDWIVLCH